MKKVMYIVALLLSAGLYPNYGQNPATNVPSEGDYSTSSLGTYAGENSYRGLDDYNRVNSNQYSNEYMNNEGKSDYNNTANHYNNSNNNNGGSLCGSGTCNSSRYNNRSPYSRGQ